MIILYDKGEKDFNSNGLGMLEGCISASINEELNGDYSLELAYPISNSKAEFLVEFNVIKANEQLFRIYKVERSQADRLGIRVWARHIFYDLAFYFIENVKILNGNLGEALQMTMPPESQALFNFKTFESTIAPFTLKESGGVDALFKLLEIYGGELKRDNFNVTIEEKIGSDEGVTVRYGKNIKGLTLTLDALNMATKLYPVGKDELLLPERYIFVENNLPFDVIKKVEFSYADTVERLRRSAEEYAKECEQPKVNIVVDFLELSKTNEYKKFKNLNKVELGDSVSVYHEKLGIKALLRVIRKQIDLLNPVNTKIELGDPLATIIEQLNSDELLEEIKKLLESNKTEVIIKCNDSTVTVTRSKYPVLVIGLTLKVS